MRPKVLFLVSVDWFFWSHFLERAVAAVESGYEVVLLTRVTTYGPAIQARGIRVEHLEFDRKSLSVLGAVKTVLKIARIYSAEKPSLVHQVALKPILLGGVAAKIARIKACVNAVVGMGYAFSGEGLALRFARAILGAFLRGLLNPKNSVVVFENSDDLEAALKAGWCRRESTVLIRGAGVAPEGFGLGKPASEPVRIVLVARMLKDKGVTEFVEAAKRLRAEGCTAEFELVGDVDSENRASLSREQLQAWRDSGLVRWNGHCADVAALLQGAQIACLPSYREGLPRSLLEAMATGLPCVTTNVPGCREAVQHARNGLLVPPGDSEALARALRTLIEDPRLRAEYGRAGRERVEREFSSRIVVRATLDLYARVCASARTDEAPRQPS